jgi:TonB family protein
MNIFNTSLSNKPLKATLLLSTLLHAAVFYILSGVSFNLESRSPDTAPIKVTALIQEKGIEPAIIKHVTKRYSRQSKYLPKLVSTKVKKIYSAQPIPTQNKNSQKYIQGHLKIRNLKTIDQVQLTSSNQFLPSPINSKEHYKNPISTIAPHFSRKNYYSAKSKTFSSTPTKDIVFTHKKNLSSQVKISSSSSSHVHDLQSSRSTPIYKNNNNQSVKPSTSVRKVSHTNGFSVEPINQSQRSTTEKTVSSFKNSTSLNMGELRRGFHRKIWQRVAHVKYYPRMARKRGFEGEPIVAFTLSSNGELIDLKLIAFSSHKILDEAALETIRRGTPYPSIPKHLKKNSISFNLPISYILNE